jgi:2-polyprenyl-6-methoxyphenol hydroxylase-like FAD-dependent oxidoreductase
MAQKTWENEKPKGRILVIGAGYAGLATAIELTKVGYEVEVIESVKSLSTQGMLPQSAA